jgi:hypothetical protein
MRFVPIKTAEQQAVLMLHRTRNLLVRQRTMTANPVARGFLPGGLSDAGPQSARIAVTGPHPKPYIEAGKGGIATNHSPPVVRVGMAAGEKWLPGHHRACRNSLHYPAPSGITSMTACTLFACPGIAMNHSSSVACVGMPAGEQWLPGHHRDCRNSLHHPAPSGTTSMTACTLFARPKKADESIAFGRPAPGGRRNSAGLVGRPQRRKVLHMTKRCPDKCLFYHCGTEFALWLTGPRH